MRGGRDAQLCAGLRKLEPIQQPLARADLVLHAPGINGRFRPPGFPTGGDGQVQIPVRGEYRHSAGEA